MRRHASLLVLPLSLPLLLSAFSADAADDDSLLAQLLTCRQPAGPTAGAAASKALEARATAGADGIWKIAGRIQAGKLCIENAQMSAAFGVMMASGSVCDGEPAALIDFLKRSDSGLKPAAEAPHPGMVAAFEAPKYAITLYRGEPGFKGSRPDPADQRLSYMCSYQGSGPQ